MMIAKLRSWWEKIRKPLGIIGIIVACLGVVVLVFVVVRLYGTGFVGKTLWDWLGLLAALAIPVVVGFGAAWFTAQQVKASERENKDNQHEAALQTYIDKISELLLHEKLRDSAEEDEVRKIARVRTLTILPRLDANRKRSVLQFLYESDLINKGKSIIVLRDADLSKANLSHVNLREADMSFAILSEANLSGARLLGANLRKVNLCGANLRSAKLYEAALDGADLSFVDLTDAIITEEQLRQPQSLKG